MILCNSKEQMMEALDKMDKNISKAVLREGQEAEVILIKRSNGQLEVKIQEDYEAFKKKKTKAAVGKKADLFMNGLRKFEKIEEVTTDFDVICFLNTEPVRKNGKIVTRWYHLPNGDSYQLTEKGVALSTIELELSEDEYTLCMQSNIALYDEFEETVYPFTQESLPAIGRALDAQAVFKSLETIPIAAAMLLSDKLSNTPNGLSLLYLNHNKRVKPVIGVGSANYVPSGQKTFFGNCMDEMAEAGVFRLIGWEINTQYTNVDVELITAEASSFKRVLRLTTSSVPGTSSSVTAYADFGTGRVKLLKNAKYHSAKTGDKSFVKELFEGINEAFASFEKKMDTPFTISASDMDTIYKSLGKKVSNTLKKERGIAKVTSGSFEDVVSSVVEATYVDLNPRREVDLQRAYQNLFIA